MSPSASLEDWYHVTCPECGIQWGQPSPDCPKVIYDRHPQVPLTEGEPMQGNNHDLVMQFARGTSALTALERIQGVLDETTSRKTDMIAQHTSALRAVDQEFSARINSIMAVVKTDLESLTSDDDDDDDDDDDPF